MYGVEFSPDGKTLASASRDKTIFLWDVRDRRQLGRPLRGHTSTVGALAFSPDGTTIVSVSADLTVRLWDARTHRPVGEPLRGHTKTIETVGFSPDGTFFTAADDGTVREWDGLVAGSRRGEAGSVRAASAHAHEGAVAGLRAGVHPDKQSC